MGIENPPIAYTAEDYVSYSTNKVNSGREYAKLKESIKMNYPKVAAASQESIIQITEEIKKLATPYTQKI